jgi:predicted PurR-regulated permease PerM
VSRALSMAISGIGGAVNITISTIAALFLIILTSVYLSVEPDFYHRGIRRIVPSASRPTFDACLASAIARLRAWLLAKVVSMTAIGLFITFGLLALHVPLAGTLGLIAALLTFIPNLGPFISVLPAALIAFAISPMKGILTVALFCVAHFLEGNIITPIAERKIASLPPALTLALQLLLGSATGALGVVLAAPFTAVLLGVLQVLLPPLGPKGEQS